MKDKAAKEAAVKQAEVARAVARAAVVAKSHRAGKALSQPAPSPTEGTAGKSAAFPQVQVRVA
jgi:hypothetical protein